MPVKPGDVAQCPGFDHQRGYDALGQPRCVHCACSWYSHRSHGRPHPSEPPEEVDPDTHPDMAWLREPDDD
jgi:hypothetical protein